MTPDPERPEVLSYQVPDPARRSRPIDRVYLAVVAMAWVWIIVPILSGVSGDRTIIPLPKKIAISVSAVIVLSLLIAVRVRETWLALFAVWAFMMIAVMWFWN